jgi:hypothetical protein
MSAGLNLLPGSRVLSDRKQDQGQVMTADRTGLGFLGFIFGGVTAAVMLVAVTVVIGHAEGRLVLDAPYTQIAAK